MIHLIENETIDKAVLTIDKVTFLKKTNIFAHTPENILVSVAERLKEVHVKAGEAIITQGEKGDCMYIITEGLVHVYSISKSIAHLGPKDFFGEFAIIDSEPRSASVAAEDETHLLRLDQSTFCALMAEQTEVARGIIKVLCQRLDKMLEKASKIEQIKVDAEESLKTFKEEKELSKEVLLPLEKVLILKTISFFSYIPDNILEEIISIIEEVKFKAEEEIVEKGEMGRSMYIITSGQVRVHDGEHIITYLENRAFFGETSVLDTKPWSASVTAEQETCLLRLDQEPLYELMADRFELANGIIYALIRQIRNLLDRQ